MIKVLASFVETKINDEKWGMKKFAEHYGISEKEFLERYKKQYKYTPTIYEEYIEKMRINEKNGAELVETENSETIKSEGNETSELVTEENDVEKTCISEEIGKEILDIELPNFEETIVKESEKVSESTDELQQLSKNYEECLVELQKLREENENIESFNKELLENIHESRHKIEDLARLLDDEEKTILECIAKVKQNSEQFEIHNQNISKLEFQIESIRKEIEDKRVIKIFCGTCSAPDEYNEVFVNETLDKSEIREVASNYFKYEEIELVLEEFLMKDFFNTVEFLILIRNFEMENNKKIEYTFENEKYKEVFELLRSLE